VSEYKRSRCYFNPPEGRFVPFGGTFQEIDKSNLMIWVCFGFEDGSLLGKQVL